MMDRRSLDMSMFCALSDMSAEYVDGDDISHAVGVNPFDASKMHGMTRPPPQNGRMNLRRGSAGR